VNGDRMGSQGSASLWWLVFEKEIHELWIGGKALYLVLMHTLLLGVYSFLLASNAELNLMPLKEMMAEIVRASIAVGGFICLIIGADSIAGERERATLEGVLLTPAKRPQLLFGKFLAAFSPWPVALAISIPYWIVLAKGDPVIGPTVLWGAVAGTLMALGLAAVGILVSTWCASNKSSMLMSLGVYLVLVLQTQVTRPGITPTVNELQRARVLQWTNPWHGMSEFLGQVVVLGASPAEKWMLLILPVLFPVLMLGLILTVASRGLRLEPEIGKKLQAAFSRRPQGAPAPQAVTKPPRPAATPRLAESIRAADRQETSQRPRPITRYDHTSLPARWPVILGKELRELWIGGKALNLTIVYAVLLGGYTFLMARHSAVSVEPPKDMVFELLKSALMFAVFMGVIIGADSLSGERERGSLEWLLLTPVQRRQIVIGKFLATVSMWPAALLISVPYFYVLAQGAAVFRQALLWGGLFGTVLILGFSAFGMLVSFWCNTNKTSLFLALGGYLLFLLPTTLTGHAQAGFMGRLVQGVNPMQGPRFFLAKVLVNNRHPVEVWPFAVSSVVFAVITLGLLFWYASPALRLEGGRVRTMSTPRRAVTAALLALLALFGGTRAWAAQDSMATMQPLRVSISMSDTVVRAGAPIEFVTEITNDAAAASPSLIVAMNIINLNAHGDVVDPEDWSPQRTQYLEAVAPGGSTTLSWTVNAILDGDFMVYIVAIPAPASAEATSQPVATSGIHLTVTPYARLNPGGVLPYVIGGPLLLAIVIFIVYRQRRRQIDLGGARAAE